MRANASLSSLVGAAPTWGEGEERGREGERESGRVGEWESGILQFFIHTYPHIPYCMLHTPHSLIQYFNSYECVCLYKCVSVCVCGCVCGRGSVRSIWYLGHLWPCYLILVHVHGVQLPLT